MDRFNKHFEEVVRHDTLYKDRFTNVNQTPKINKAFLNAGIGRKAVADGRHVSTALLALEHITGQKPIVTRAKKWVDKFQLKKKMPIGRKPTLRPSGSNLYRFADRLINQVSGPLLTVAENTPQRPGHLMVRGASRRVFTKRNPGGQQPADQA